MRANWFVWCALLVGCGFGDNLATQNRARHACGDGVVDPGEGCDDGNLTDRDGCTAACEVESAAPVCGNGIRETGEGCDDGNTAAGDGCSAACTAESVCGNHLVEPGEACDDGNLTSGDGCSPACAIETAAACMLVPQGGCSGATPACDLADDNTTACRAVTTQGNSNSHCTTGEQCRVGYTCAGDANPAHARSCARFCIADTDCTGTGSRCVDSLDDDTGAPLNISVCSNACDAYTQSGCPTGMGCVVHDAAAGDFTDCVYPGARAEGQTCTGNDCEAGFACVTAGQTSTCRAYCHVGAPSTCNAGETCAAFVSPITIGSIQYGACL